MQLNEEQKQQVAAWLEAGAKLSDVQQRLAEELGIRLTYMEARFLLDDLKLSVQEAKSAEPVSEPVAPVPESEVGADSVEPGPADPIAGMPEGFDESEPEGAPGGVSVKVDTLARPGAMVSGSVVFSDGNRAEWYLDQMGRLGMKAESPGYRPPQADVAQFQQALERELAKMGF
jgi:hypothetical protein